MVLCSFVIGNCRVLLNTGAIKMLPINSHHSDTFMDELSCSLWYTQAESHIASSFLTMIPNGLIILVVDSRDNIILVKAKAYTL